MQISLHDLHPNPYRDFELHPIDPVQVERLKASIDADGFWASVVARKANDGYQIAFGHHRIEAARALGLETAPIEVRDLDDWQMVRMLASENATQRGITAAAALDAVQAICRVLAYELLRWDEATFARFHAKVGINYASCRGRLEAGSGIGTSCVLAFAPKGTLSEHQIRLYLGVLKDSGRMAGIIATAQARAGAELRAEQADAERALAAAQAREAEARDAAGKAAAAKETKQAKQTAARRRQATDAAGKAVASAQRQPLIYDPRCTALFKVESHAETFRQIVTGETFQSYLSLDQQYPFAKAVLAAIRENDPKKKEITAADIRTYCWGRMESGVG
jgi:ParB-like chromosome segregation protein Spo0J